MSAGSITCYFDCEACGLRKVPVQVDGPVPIGHCLDTEQCVRDVYCNCPCAECESQPCMRPGCECGRRHPNG